MKTKLIRRPNVLLLAVFIASAVLSACTTPTKQVAEPLGDSAATSTAERPSTQMPRVTAASWGGAETYRCSAEVTLQIQTAQEAAQSPSQPLAVDQQKLRLTYQGLVLTMQQVPTLVGARFVADDAQNSYRWVKNGEVGTLLYRASDRMAEEVMVADACVRQAVG